MRCRPAADPHQTLVWGVDDPADLVKQVPRLRLVEDVSFLTMPDLVARLARSRISGALHRMMGRLPGYRDLVRHLRYQFP